MKLKTDTALLDPFAAKCGIVFDFVTHVGRRVTEPELQQARRARSLLLQICIPEPAEGMPSLLGSGDLVDVSKFFQGRVKMPLKDIRRGEWLSLPGVKEEARIALTDKLL